ncbi:dodecin family protein [Verrucomicrobiales bacterium]|nr:dodecin family protein [Verrucomicrobiales bacterium]
MNNPSMSIAKVIEVIAEGNTVENAIKNAASEAGKSIRNVKHINVENIQGIVVDGKVESFRVNAKVTFVVD